MCRTASCNHALIQRTVCRYATSTFIQFSINDAAEHEKWKWKKTEKSCDWKAKKKKHILASSNAISFLLENHWATNQRNAWSTGVKQLDTHSRAHLTKLIGNDSCASHLHSSLRISNVYLGYAPTYYSTRLYFTFCFFYFLVGLLFIERGVEWIEVAPAICNSCCCCCFCCWPGHQIPAHMLGGHLNICIYL